MRTIIILIYTSAFLLFVCGIYLSAEARQALATNRGKGNVVDISAHKLNTTARNGFADVKSLVSAERQQWSLDNRNIKSLEQVWRSNLASAAYDTKKAFAITNRIRVRLRFAEIYPSLGLSAKAVEDFETRAAAANIIFSPYIGTAEGKQSNDQREAKKLDQAVTASFGPEYVAVFREYLATSDFRMIASELAASSIYAEATMTPEQADQLVKLCVEHSTSESGVVRIDPETVDWERVANSAGDFLAPAQLKALKAMIAKRNFDLQYNQISGIPSRPPVRGL
jgi:hypothetical protein